MDWLVGWLVATQRIASLAFRLADSPKDNHVQSSPFHALFFLLQTYMTGPP